MATKTQALTSSQAHKNFKEHWQARRRAHAEGATWRTLSNLATLEDKAWKEYIDALRREARKRDRLAKFIPPERPI